MKLCEFFLRETTEEDRAILSLSSAIYRYIQQFETIDDGDGNSWKDHDYDDDLDYDEIEDDKPIRLGRISDLFDTPLVGLGHVILELQPDYGIRLYMKKIDKERMYSPEDKLVYGFWDASNDRILLNKDFIGSNALRLAVTHELRHALDDFKSDYKANLPNTSYTRPRKKEHRAIDQSDSAIKMDYKAQPAEINARFSEVLHLLTASLLRASRIPGKDLRSHALTDLKKFLADKHISELFPEGTESRDYKRLLKRAVDFINKEINHLTKND